MKPSQVNIRHYAFVLLAMCSGFSLAQLNFYNCNADQQRDYSVAYQIQVDMAQTAYYKMRDAYKARSDSVKRGAKAAADYAQTRVLGITRPEDETIRMRGWLSATIVSDYHHANDKPRGFQNALDDMLDIYGRMRRGSFRRSSENFWDARHICLSEDGREFQDPNFPIKKVYIGGDGHRTAGNIPAAGDGERHFRWACAPPFCPGNRPTYLNLAEGVGLCDGDRTTAVFREEPFRIIFLCPLFWRGQIPIQDFPTSNSIPGKMVGKANEGAHDLEGDLKKLDIYAQTAVGWIFKTYALWQSAGLTNPHLNGDNGAQGQLVNDYAAIQKLCQEIRTGLKPFDRDGSPDYLLVTQSLTFLLYTAIVAYIPSKWISGEAEEPDMIEGTDVVSKAQKGGEAAGQVKKVGKVAKVLGAFLL